MKHFIHENLLQLHIIQARSGYIAIHSYHGQIAGALVVCCTCQCGNCKPMPTSLESICCCVLDEVAEKMQEGGSKVSYIINHVGFHSVCLDVWVL